MSVCQFEWLKHFPQTIVAPNVHTDKGDQTPRGGGGDLVTVVEGLRGGWTAAAEATAM